jgi:hypothetical protein
MSEALQNFKNNSSLALYKTKADWFKKEKKARLLSQGSNLESDQYINKTMDKGDLVDKKYI